jgi:hypothetical protein
MRFEASHKHRKEFSDMLNEFRACVAWKAFYNDDLNRDFWNLGPDPNALLPGDSLHVPDEETKAELCSTAHVLPALRNTIGLRFIVRDVDGEPLAREKYQVDGTGEIPDGILCSDALHDVIVPPCALEGTLAVWVRDDLDLADVWTLKLGHLDLIDNGSHARLHNLGYDCGPVDGVNGSRMQVGVRAFQKERSLQVDGVAGPETQAALVDQHTC